MQLFGKKKRPAHAPRRARPGLEVLERRDLLTVYLVSPFSPGASDFSGNGTTVPFQSIQRAINVATNGDEIRLAGGVYYTYSAANDIVPGGFSLLSSLGSSAVAVVFNKFLTINGGFNAGVSWDTPDPTTPSIIEGQGGIRGVWVTASANGGAGLSLNNVTVAHGIGTPIPARGGISQFEGFGGGLFAEKSFLSLSNDVFFQNVAYGGPNAKPVGGLGSAGGDGAGGGIAIVTAPGQVNLSNITLVGNGAKGALGATIGGIGQGGGLFATGANITITGLDARNNFAVGGASAAFGNTSGLPGLTGASGDPAAALGGAISLAGVQFGVISHATVVDNTAVGGPAPQSQGGSAKGGGINFEGTSAVPGTLTVADSLIQGNTAFGGTGAVVQAGIGGAVFGGGFDSINGGSIIMNRVIVQENFAKGGKGSSLKPTVVGGGIALLNTLQPAAQLFTGTNLVIAQNVAAFGSGNNEASGGGGGGLSDAGYAVSLIHATIADNILGDVVGGLFGQGILLYSGVTAPSSLTLAFSIVANENNSQTPPAAALAVISGSAGLLTDLFANNSVNVSGNTNGTPLLAPSAGFQTLDPNFPYGLTSNSPALGAALTSGTSVDVFNSARGGMPDLGAVQHDSSFHEPLSARAVDAVFSSGF